MTGSIPVYRQQSERRRRDELIQTHLPLVKHATGRLIGDLPMGVDVENLEAAGVLGLVEAAAKFDPNRNAQFKTFAYLRIRGAVVDELRRNSPLPQHVHVRVSAIRRAYRTLPHPVTVEALAGATGLTFDEVTDTLAAERFAKTTSWEQVAEPGGVEPSGSTESPHGEIERWEMSQQLTDAIAGLPPYERLAVTMHYREDLRLREISEILNLSISQISRILNKAVLKLRGILRAKRGLQLVHGQC